MSTRLLIGTAAWCLALLALGATAYGQNANGDAALRGAAPRPPLSEAAQQWLNDERAAEFGAWLKSQLQDDPDAPEWLHMFAEILHTSGVGPNHGWFRTALAQTRYPWEVIRDRWDSNDDGRIAADEFPGREVDFLRLDRTFDSVLTEEDFDWSQHALTPSPGMAIFMTADRDSNGKVTRAEFNEIFTALDSDQTEFLSQSDLRRIFSIMGGGPGGAGHGPTRATLIKGLFQQEIGSMKPGPAVGEQAPDFTLKTVDGETEVKLSERVGTKPVVLVFGNITCGPFRSQSGDVEKLYQRYHDQADFLMVYVREAHPTDGWHMVSNDYFRVSLPQPATYDQRVQVAQTCQSRLELSMPLLVDTIDDQVGSEYSGMPSRLYLIDTEGKVAYKSGRGPFGFHPGQLEQALIMLLLEKATP